MRGCRISKAKSNCFVISLPIDSMFLPRATGTPAASMKKKSLEWSPSVAPHSLTLPAKKSAIKMSPPSWLPSPTGQSCANMSTPWQWSCSIPIGLERRASSVVKVPALQDSSAGMSAAPKAGGSKAVTSGQVLLRGVCVPSLLPGATNFGQALSHSKAG
jgi:hypothetical protein